MSQRIFVGSLARLSGLHEPFALARLPREAWETADFVVGEFVSNGGPLSRVELATGRLIDVIRGDRLLGALGSRAATLEAVGDWREVGPDDQLDLMTPAGLLGKITSQSPYLGALPILRYQGHVMVQGAKASMKDYVGSVPHHPLGLPVVLVIGTSMSAGKTTAGRVIVRLLKEGGRSVVAAKLTGAGRYRDILSLHDAGADTILDFVEVGLPSTVMSEDEFRPAIEQLLSRISRVEADVLVAEAGSSPLEPYNGGLAVEALGERVKMLVLCASDPYAALGVMLAFKRTPDLICGICANTSAGIELTRKLTGVPTVNILEEKAQQLVGTMLREKLT